MTLASRPVEAAPAVADDDAPPHSTASPIALERDHVHAVYERIAGHFSATRYAPWPVVARFLAARPPGSVGCDVGCGNGKYLLCNPAVFLVGSDRSAGLAAIAAGRADGRACADVLRCDGLATPTAPGRMDFCLCVAVLHHYATHARRVAAVAHLLDCLRPGGEALVYVWALEQATSRRGWAGGDPQDVMVPWKTAAGATTTTTTKTSEVVVDDEPGRPVGGGRVYERFYHLYREGELEADTIEAGGEVVESGYDRDNWWAILRRA